MILLYVILCTADEALKDGVCTFKLLVKKNKNGTLATDVSILPADGCATVCSFALTSQSREDSTQLTRICRKSEGYLSVFILLTLTLEGEFPPPYIFVPFLLPSLSFVPLRSRPPLRPGGLGVRISSPSGSGQSQAAKRIFMQFTAQNMLKVSSTVTGKLFYFFAWNSEAPALGGPLDFLPALLLRHCWSVGSFYTLRRRAGALSDPSVFFLSAHLSVCPRAQLPRAIGTLAAR